MPYTFSDVNGYIGDGPTITGRSQLHAFVAQQDMENFPAMVQLLAKGYTTATMQLALEARNLAKRCDNLKVRSTLNFLAAHARKAKEMIMMEV